MSEPRTTASSDKQPSPHKVIRASAGSGKTFRLSGRYLQLLCDGADPAGILATTFTRKAAGEVLGRVMTRLASAAESDANARTLAEQIDRPLLTRAMAQQVLGRAVGQMHRLQVGTIDRFFARAASAFELELGLPSGFRAIASNTPEGKRLRMLAVAEALDPDDLGLLRPMLRQVDRGKAQSGVASRLLELVEDLEDAALDSDASAWRRVHPLPELGRETLTTARQNLQTVGDAVATIQDKRAVPAWRGDMKRASGGDWQVFLKAGLAKPLAMGRDKYYRATLPEPVQAVYRPLVAHAKAAFLNTQIRSTEAAREFLDRYADAWAMVCHRHGVVLFQDLPRKLAGADDLLGFDSTSRAPETAGLFERLDAQVRHLLIDEFQDTSPSQWRVLGPIAQEVCRAEHEAPDDPQDRSGRSVLVVGDVKQAIYGWRGGCAEVFDTAEQDLALDERHRESLTKSFRSSPVVLNAVNRLFGQVGTAGALKDDLRQPAQDWSGGFENHVAADQTLPGFFAIDVTRPVEDDDASTDHGRHSADQTRSEDDDEPPASAAHLTQAAELVRRLTQTHPGRTVGVLAVRNKTVGALQQALAVIGVASSGQGGVRVGDHPAAGVILSALRFADHPGDTASAWRVRHSPLCAAAGLEGYVRPGMPGGAALLNQAAARLRRQAMGRGLGPVITGWARLLAPGSDAAGVATLERLATLGDQADASGLPIRLGDFAQASADATVDDPSPTDVRVMTVHKAKGLEFDAVVLPELRSGRPMGSVGKQSVWRLRDRPMDPPKLVFRAFSKEMLDLIEPAAPELGDAYRQEVRARLMDELSALYVATTRARHALHLVLEPVEPTKNGWSSKGTTNATPESLVREAFGVKDHDEYGRVLEVGNEAWSSKLDATLPVGSGESGTAAQALGSKDAESVALRFDPKTPAARAMRSVSPSSLGHDGGRGWRRPRLGREENADAKPSATRLGSAVHGLFELVGFIDDPDGEPTPDAGRMRLAAEGLEDLFAPAWAMFRDALAQPALREALARTGPGDTLVNEASFSFFREGQIMAGRIDRLVRHADGRATVLDFKTDRFDAPPSESLLAEWAERYRGQLGAYRDAASRLLGVDSSAVRCGLLAVRAGQVVWLERDGANASPGKARG
ncbi:MAG: UvrD-helicase domain-containing protein [Planctomycetota bacterium]